MPFNTQLENAVNTIIDVCTFHEGNCATCELKAFCEAAKPIEMLNN